MHQTMTLSTSITAQPQLRESAPLLRSSVFDDNQWQAADAHAFPFLIATELSICDSLALRLVPLGCRSNSKRRRPAVVAEQEKSCQQFRGVPTWCCVFASSRSLRRGRLPARLRLRGVAAIVEALLRDDLRRPTTVTDSVDPPASPSVCRSPQRCGVVFESGQTRRNLKGKS